MDWILVLIGGFLVYFAYRIGGQAASCSYLLSEIATELKRAQSSTAQDTVVTGPCANASDVGRIRRSVEDITQSVERELRESMSRLCDTCEGVAEGLEQINKAMTGVLTILDANLGTMRPLKKIVENLSCIEDDLSRLRTEVEPIEGSLEEVKRDLSDVAHPNIGETGEDECSP